MSALASLRHRSDAVANSPRRIFSVAILLAHDIMKTYRGIIAVSKKRSQGMAKKAKKVAKKAKRGGGRKKAAKKAPRKAAKRAKKRGR
jgi:hypothetical protein